MSNYADPLVETILAAAERALATMDPVTMQAIAKEAGVDVLAVRDRFTDERAVFAEVFRRRHLAYFDAVDQVLLAHDTLEGGVEGLVRILLDLPAEELEARRRLNTQLPVAWSARELRNALGIIQRRMVEWAIHMVDDVTQSEMRQRVYHCLGIVRGLAMMRFLELEGAPPTSDVVLSTRALLVRMLRHGAA
ncbi:MAG: TetR/AcrR family transcriptional regulator [Sandaracinaceae bacterium]